MYISRHVYRFTACNCRVNCVSYCYTDLLRKVYMCHAAGLPRNTCYVKNRDNVTIFHEVCLILTVKIGSTINASSL